MANYKNKEYGIISFKKLRNILDGTNTDFQGYNRQYLRNNGIHANTISKLNNDENVTCEVISHLCHLLNCQPGDILEYIPDASLTNQK